MGRNGVYYRKTLSGKERRNAGAGRPPLGGDWDSAFSDATRAATTENLAPPSPWGPWIAAMATGLIIGRMSSYVAAEFGAPVAINAGSTGIVAGFVAGAIAFILMRRRRGAALIYELHGVDSPTAHLLAVFARLRMTDVWLVSSSPPGDAMAHGANAEFGHRVHRQPVVCSTQPPRHITANIPVPTLRTSRATIMLLPDQVVVASGGEAYSYTWDEVKASVGGVTFIEPSERSAGQLVGWAYQHENIGGGPDRRFSFNRSFPKYRYGTVTMELASATPVRFVVADPNIAAALTDAINAVNLPEPQTQRDAESHATHAPKSKPWHELTLLQRAMLTWRDEYRRMWRMALSIDSMWVSNRFDEIKLANHDTDNLALVDAAHIYAAIAQADDNVSLKERSSFDHTMSIEGATLYDDEHILEVLADSFHDRLTQGFTTIVDFDSAHGTRLSSTYIKAAEALMQKVIASYPSGSADEARVITEIRKAMERESGRADAPAAADSTATLLNQDAANPGTQTISDELVVEPDRVTAGSERHLEPKVQAIIDRIMSDQREPRSGLSPKYQAFVDSVMGRESDTSRGRDATSRTTTGEAQTSADDAGLEVHLTELDRLIGLGHVKEDVRELANFLYIQRLRAKEGLPTRDVTYHLVFTGNPGTGKTTVARILARILGALGVVGQGHLVETDRSQLVGRYVGQTEPRVRRVIEKAMGGVLFIDEAYALAGRGDEDYGHAAIDTLVKAMEDNREDLVVIAAGYPKPMAEFLTSNPGLASRFRRSIEFPDYTTDELVEIFELFCSENGYAPDVPAIAALRARLDAEPRTERFGNARLIRNWFEDAIEVQANRLRYQNDIDRHDHMQLTAADLSASDAREAT